MSILETLEKYEPKSLHHETPVIWDKANNWTVYNQHGKQYIDFTSGIFVANIGHRRLQVYDAIVNQAYSLMHSYVFPNEPRAKLVEKLVKISRMEKVYLCSTGSEAVEAAIRCMKVYSGGQTGIVGLINSYHGRTQGCRDIDKVLFPKVGIKNLTGFLPQGLIVESYYGYNAEFHDKGWIQELCAEAQDNNIPVCFDEVQAGFGRTGKMFGFEHYDVKPDLIVVGKALSGCLPISAVIGRADLLDAPDDLSSTHTGNPICCAAALANLEILESEHLVDRAFEFGQKLATGLPELFPDYTIRGNGMVWAIDLQNVELANLVVDIAADKGVLMVKTHKGTLKIGAPLIIPWEVLCLGLVRVRNAIQEALE